MNDNALDAKFTPVETGAIVPADAKPLDAGMLFPATTPVERINMMREVATAFVGEARRLDKEARDNGRRPLIVRMEDKNTGTVSEHITLPLWRALGMMLPRSVVASTVPGSVERTTNGYKAQSVVRFLDGTIIGHAEGECGRDESFWARQPGYAVGSMAQTRAQSKAYRSILDFLVVLAGFNPTPGEEMPNDKSDKGAKEPKPDPEPQKLTDDEKKKRRARIFALVDEYAQVAPEAAKVLQDDDTRHGIYQRLFGKHRLDELSSPQVDALARMIKQRIDESTPGERK
jgi:hypothetical protein